MSETQLLWKFSDVARSVVREWHDNTTSAIKQLHTTVFYVLCDRKWHSVCCCRNLGFWHRVDLQVDADVWEKHAVSIFRGWSDKARKQRAYIGPEHVSSKRRHRPTNLHGVKTQDFYNMIIIAVRTSNLIYRRSIYLKCSKPTLFHKVENVRTELTNEIKYFLWTQFSLPIKRIMQGSRISVSSFKY
jgi:hypothetical protein